MDKEIIFIAIVLWFNIELIGGFYRVADEEFKPKTKEQKLITLMLVLFIGLAGPLIYFVFKIMKKKGLIE